MTREQLLTYLDIDPAIEEETRRRFAQWRPESQINPDEIGLYYQVPLSGYMYPSGNNNNNNSSSCSGNMYCTLSVQWLQL